MQRATLCAAYFFEKIITALRALSQRADGVFNGWQKHETSWRRLRIGRVFAVEMRGKIFNRSVSKQINI